MSPRKHSRSQRGATSVEMSLVGIPIIFILISIFEISRGMWMYHTCAFAVKDGVRYAQVHGVNCIPTAGNPNSCEVYISDVATVIQNAAVGLDFGQTQLIFLSQDGTSYSCYLGSGVGTTCASLSATQWPPSAANAVGNLIKIQLTTPFKSALAMFWPGAKAVRFGTATFGATSSDYIQF